MLGTAVMGAATEAVAGARWEAPVGAVVSRAPPEPSVSGEALRVPVGTAVRAAPQEDNRAAPERPTPDGGMDATGGANPDAGVGLDGGNAGRGGSASRPAAERRGGTGAYNPCPTSGSPCKILPFGDSITQGVKSSDDAGYRSQLFKLIVAAKQKVTFTGSLTNGPTQVSGQTFPRMHEGHPGWTIDPGYNVISSSYGGISSLVPSPALNGDPHIILLHIGTNDLFARDTANMSTRLEALIDKIARTRRAR